MENKQIVIETGSYSTKVGFSGENHPQEIFPTVFGKNKWFRLHTDRGFAAMKKVTKPIRGRNWGY